MRYTHHSEPTVVVTRSGKMMDLSKPDKSQIDICDIAFSLHGQHRFTGHTRYSVADHCISGANHFQEKGYHYLAKEFLIHDASECYTGDISRPLKALCGDQFVKIEKEIQGLIREKFGLSREPIAGVYNIIKQMDNALAAVEMRELLHSDLLIQPMPFLDVELITGRSFLTMFNEMFSSNKGTQ